MPFVQPDMISGGIIMWSGSIATIPAGYVLCDGNNDTPDLRDKFIVGAKEDDAGVAKTNITGALTKSGGTLGHTHGFTSELHGHDIPAGEGINAGENYAAGTTAETVIGATDNEDHISPYYSLAYIMKT